MKNLRIIEYFGGFQVKIYWYTDEFLMGYYLSDEDKERRERRKRIREELERQSYATDRFTEVDMDWEEIWEQYEREKLQRKMDKAVQNASRAKQNVYYLARSNEWEWFVTLTLNKEKIERYDYDELSKRVKKWLNNLKQRKAPELYYLIVPEQHKDGAWHFHCLLGGCEGLEFVYSGRRTSRQTGRKRIYNLEDFKYGFTECTKVVDTERVSAYICKYITKTMCAATEGRNRYWVSKNCKRAEITEYCLGDQELLKYKESLYDIMSYKKRVVTEWCTVDYFEIPKGEKESELAWS